MIAKTRWLSSVTRLGPLGLVLALGCTEPGEIGDVCSFDSDCDIGLACVYGSCIPEDDPGGYGEPCGTTADCGPWLVCEAGFCTLGDHSRGPGEPCELESQCYDTLLCRDGICSAHDGTCSSNDHCIASFCDDGLCCGDDVCMPGEDCLLDCAPLECGNYLCQPSEDCETCPTDCGSCPPPPPPPLGDECNDLEPLSWRGVVPLQCYWLNDYELLLADEMYTVWRQSPTALCSYNGLNYVSGLCGQLPPANASYCPLDDQISWDANMMNEFAYTLGEFASVTILAHEWGHLNQQRAGILQSPSTKGQELHADCQAGIYAAVAESRGIISEYDITSSFASLCTFGDSFISPWFAPGAHGTCQERIQAFQYGYLNARVQLDAVCSDNPLLAMRNICG